MVTNNMPMLSSPAKAWLIAMLVITCVPQLGQIPLWLLSVFCVVIGWSALLIKNPHWPAMPVWIKRLLTLAVGLGILLSASKIGSLNGLSTLLIAGASLKLLELKTRRDAWILVLVACFIAAENFLFNNSLAFGLHGLLSLVVIFAALNATHRGYLASWSWQPLKVSGKIMLQSVPVMLLFFVLFPRIEPLWSVKFDGAVAKTGLSESMDFGSVGELTRSDAIAFRVSFAGDQPPDADQLYWRAISYENFDGVRWDSLGYSPVKTISDSSASPSPSDSFSELVNYKVIAEPSARPWLFSLDYPVASQSSGLIYLADGSVQANEPILERYHYQLRSNLAAPLEPNYLPQAERYLQLPKTGNEQTRNMVAGWIKQGYAQQQIINALLGIFNQSFTYTLSPPKLFNDRIDEFLFETQAGFCEHFAGSMAFALRVAGIPSRVVGGYLGGEWNPYEKYMLVRQYQAHAWVEAWLPQRGWVRIDPTAAVAPERVESTIDEMFGEDEAFMSDSPLSLIQFERSVKWLGQARLRYEALNYRWHRWVIGYHNEQSQVLQRWFGALSALKTIAIVLLPLFLVMGLLLLGLLHKKRRKLHYLDRHLTTLSQIASKSDTNLARQPSETAAQYTQRLSNAYPKRKEQLQQWLGSYQSLRYRDLPDQERSERVKKYNKHWRNLKRLL